MHDQLSLIVADRTENHARILLSVRESSDIAEIAGTVRGPYSEFAKTLTADFPLKPTATGGVESLIEHPGQMTHLSVAGTGAAVADNLVRLSVGIEHIDDLLADLETAIAAVTQKFALQV